MHKCFSLTLLYERQANWSLEFPNSSDTNQPVQSQTKRRSLKFQIFKNKDGTIRVRKTKTLISFAVTAQLISVFVFGCLHMQKFCFLMTRLTRLFTSRLEHWDQEVLGSSLNNAKLCFIMKTPIQRFFKL